MRSQHNSSRHSAESGRRINSRLTLAALEKAIAERQPPPGLVHHSDRGVQYACHEYAALLQKQGMIASMSRPGNPYDNALCESFMRTLKREEINASEYRDMEDLRIRIEDFIARYYNKERLHSALGYVSPEAFEAQQSQNPASKAATVTLTFGKASTRLGLGTGTPTPSPSPDPNPLLPAPEIL